ncbi:hypothetical protein [Prevotella sp. oral taxon 376]|uniref:hypothetical protein n=1 Tax=Prevotella sp. oral taxon 376 TaxID=712466 RepID=UPI0011B219FB|nr:hypothetical protein [Prevotella sp. oral taxon 376]
MRGVQIQLGNACALFSFARVFSIGITEIFCREVDAIVNGGVCRTCNRDCLLMKEVLLSGKGWNGNEVCVGRISNYDRSCANLICGSGRYQTAFRQVAARSMAGCAW